MHIGGTNTLRLWPCFAVMLCRGERPEIPLLMRCVAICYAERERLRLWLFSVLTGDAGGPRACFWPYLTIGPGGFANSHFPEREGVAMWEGNPSPLTACPLFVLNLVVPRFPFCDGVNILKIINKRRKMRFVLR